MCQLLFLCTITSLFLGAPPASAVDLTKVDRTIGKEPAYVSKAPKYCLLVFGPKVETRVWLVLDLVSEPYDAKGHKDVLYVDRNGNGDITEPDKRVPVTMREWKEDLLMTSPFRIPAATLKAFEEDPDKRFVKRYAPRFLVGSIKERDGKAEHTGLEVGVEPYLQDYRPCSIALKVNGLCEQRAGGRLLRFGDSPQNAPIIHFNGPLTMRLDMETGITHVPISYLPDGPERRRWYEQHPPVCEERQLVRGQEASLIAKIGTPGLGRGTFVTVSAEAVPAGGHPIADIVFPHQNAAQPPIKIRVVLKERC
jgi:hypothetical protein